MAGLPGFGSHWSSLLLEAGCHWWKLRYVHLSQQTSILWGSLVVKFVTKLYLINEHNF